MPSSSASTRDSWSEPLALEIFRISDVGAILQETVPSVSMTSTTHNNRRVSMATFYSRSHLHPLPTGPSPGEARPGGATVANPPRPLIFHQSRGIDGGDWSGWTEVSSGLAPLHSVTAAPCLKCWPRRVKGSRHGSLDSAPGRGRARGRPRSRDPGGARPNRTAGRRRCADNGTSRGASPEGKTAPGGAEEARKAGKAGPGRPADHRACPSVGLDARP